MPIKNKTTLAMLSQEEKQILFEEYMITIWQYTKDGNRIVISWNLISKEQIMYGFKTFVEKK